MKWKNFKEIDENRKEENVLVYNSRRDIFYLENYRSSYEFINHLYFIYFDELLNLPKYECKHEFVKQYAYDRFSWNERTDNIPINTEIKFCPECGKRIEIFEIDDEKSLDSYVVKTKVPNDKERVKN